MLHVPQTLESLGAHLEGHTALEEVPGLAATARVATSTDAVAETIVTPGPRERETPG